jgi:hypothetical protein
MLGAQSEVELMRDGALGSLRSKQMERQLMGNQGGNSREIRAE